MRRLALALILAAGPAIAQAPEATRDTPGAVLRGLDKISGQTSDLEIRDGQRAELGRLTVSVQDCRVPADNPTGDAFAHVIVYTDTSDQPVFSGWMVASSPALNALDHPRYDVWVLSCINS
jgi:hypothetical protein